MEVSGYLYAPAALPAGKNNQYSFNGEPRRPQRPYGRFGEDKILFPLQAFASRFLVFVTFVAHHALSYLAFLTLYIGIIKYIGRKSNIRLVLVS
jgi:hypothetical protein